MTNRVPAVTIVVLKDEDVLLVRHGEAAGHITGAIGIPGGRVDSGETSVIAAQRELKEESGLYADLEDLIEIPKKYEADFARKDGSRLYVHTTVFACDKFNGELEKSDETIPMWTPVKNLRHMTLMVNVEDMVSQAKKILDKNLPD